MGYVIRKKERGPQVYILLARGDNNYPTVYPVITQLHNLLTTQQAEMFLIIIIFTRYQML